VSRPGSTFPPGKTRYALYRRLGEPQGRSGQVQKITPPPGFDPRTVRPVGSHYTDCATQPTTFTFLEKKVIQRIFNLRGSLIISKIKRPVPLKWANFYHVHSLLVLLGSKSPYNNILLRVLLFLESLVIRMVETSKVVVFC